MFQRSSMSGQTGRISTYLWTLQNVVPHARVSLLRLRIVLVENETVLLVPSDGGWVGVERDEAAPDAQLCVQPSNKSDRVFQELRSDAALMVFALNAQPADFECGKS